jgi:hypothetical protein
MRYFQGMRRLVPLVAMVSSACGLALGGTFDSPPAEDEGGAPPPPDEASVVDSPGPPGDPDAAQDDAVDAIAAKDVADVATCTPLPADSGILGTLDLSVFVAKQDAVYNSANDKMLTLTPSGHGHSGAGWYPTMLPVVVSYDLTFEFRVGPGDTAGDGITWAVLQTATMPDAGNNGDGLGLDGLDYPGYAVIVDMHQSAPTDDDDTTLKLATMPNLKIIAHTGLNQKLDDGNLHSVDVSFRAPSSLSATLHAPGKDVTLAKLDNGFAQTAPAWVGFTGSTGGSASAHNEIASANMKSACR